MTTAHKPPKPKPKPGTGRWRIGKYELKHTAITLFFSSVAVVTTLVTQENVMALWDHPGYAASIGLIVAGVLKLAHQAFSDNSKQVA